MTLSKLQVFCDMFNIEKKVALVTRGAFGVGFETAKELLKNGARGVVIADADTQAGEIAEKELRREFGNKKVVFVQTDVSNKVSFEDAFKQTISEFKNIDILVNTAGIYDEQNYEKEIAINLAGTVHGTLLAHENYILNHKTGTEGVIVNTSSIAGCYPIPSTPIYGATKSGVLSLTLSLGHEVHFEKTKIKVAAIAPGATTSNLLDNPVYRNGNYKAVAARTLSRLIPQPASFVAKEIIKIIKEKPTGTIWICEESQEIYEYIPASPFKRYY